MSKRKRDSRQEEEGIEPSDLDIILGRHKYCFHHVGNKSFRTLIANNSEWYASVSTKRDKMAVVAFLLNLIQSGKGRFLKEGPSFSQWHEVDNRIAREKISHALRDQANQKMFRNKKESSNDLSESEDSEVSDSHAYIEQKQDGQTRHFVAPFQSPDCWGNLVLETLKESTKPIKSGAMKKCASSNSKKDKTKPGSNVAKLKQAPYSNMFAANRHDTILSDAWPAQRISTTTPMCGEMSDFFSIDTTTHHSTARTMEVGFDRSLPPPNGYAGLDNGFRRQTPNFFRNSVLETLQESLRVSKAVNATLASSSDLSIGPQFDDATESGFNFELKQTPNANTFGQKRHSTISRNTWTAQHASMATHEEEPRYMFSTSAATNSLLATIQKSLRVSEAISATLASSSFPNRGTPIDDVSKPRTKFELKRAPNSNIVEQGRQDNTLSNAWAAQHASTVTRTGETRDIFSPRATTSSWNSLKPRLVASTQWSPYSHIEPRSTTSLRRQSLGDTPLDHSQEAYSLETNQICEDIGNPLPLSDDSHVSGDIADYLGSFAQDSHADYGADDHDNLEDEEIVDTNDHEIASHEVAGTNQSAVPDFGRSTDQELDAIILELFRR
jgi:hypothetical protein